MSACSLPGPGNWGENLPAQNATRLAIGLLALSFCPAVGSASVCDGESSIESRELLVPCVFPQPSQFVLLNAPPLPNAPSYRVTEETASGGAPDRESAFRGQQLTANDAEPAVKYRPLTPAQKLDIFYRSTYDPFTFLSVAFDAGIAHAEGDFRGYGGGMPGYGKRFGALLADNEASIFFSRFLFPWMLKQDPRYFRMEKGPIPKRAVYAISRVLVTRTDHGGSSFNTSTVLGRLAGTTLANFYYPPERRGTWPTLRRTGDALTSEATMALAREFWPDIRNSLLGRRLPRKVSGLADKMVTGK